MLIFSLKLAITGMIIVYLFLQALILIISFIGFFFNRKKVVVEDDLSSVAIAAACAFKLRRSK